MEGLLRTASITDRVSKAFEKLQLPRNRYGRRRMNRYIAGHTPGPMHRNLSVARSRCQVEIAYPNGHTMVCNELLPSYRDECLWHDAVPVWDEISIFNLGKQGSARKAISAANV